MGVRVLVTGGRRFKGRWLLWSGLGLMHTDLGVSALCHGATPTGTGADWLADEFGAYHGIPVKRYGVVVKWDGPWPGAGPNRNLRMMLDFMPDWVVAFPGGAGTQNMCYAANSYRVRIWRPAEYFCLEA